VGDESRIVGPGSVAFVPVHMPHGFANAGDTDLHIFSVTARFEDPTPDPPTGSGH
jgi:mannose-6-phosphate isomerase-like protein (cupin superfamily)